MKTLVLLASILFAKIIRYNDQTLESDQNTDRFVMFYNPACPHCQKMMPHWLDLGNAETHLYGLYDTSKNSKYATRLKVNSVPTFVMFKSDGNVYKFTGDRSTYGLKNAFNDKSHLTKISDHHGAS